MANKKHRYLDRYDRDGWERDIHLEARHKGQVSKGKGTRKQQLKNHIKNSYKEAEWS